MVFDSEKWMPLKNYPLWSHNFIHINPFLCPCHVKAFHLMAEMALLHSPFQGGHSESAKRHLAAVLMIGHVMLCPWGVVDVVVECVNAQEHKRVVFCCFCVCVCLHMQVYVCVDKWHMS